MNRDPKKHRKFLAYSLLSSFLIVLLWQVNFGAGKITWESYPLDSNPNATYQDTNVISDYDFTNSKGKNDGRFVAFTSNRTDHVSGDTNGLWDVFVRDRRTGEIFRASTKDDESQFTTCDSANPSMALIHTGSAKILRVAFSCINSSTPSGHIYVKEFQVNDTGTPGLAAGQTLQVSCTRTPTQVCVEGGASQSVSSGFSEHPKISGNGRYVVFSTSATDLITDTNMVKDVYRQDLSNGQFAIISVGGPTGGGYSDFGAVNTDGSHIAFISNRDLISLSGFTTRVHVYLRNLNNLTTELVSRTSGTSWTAGDADSAPCSTGDTDESQYNVGINGDGRWVVFASSATNLASNAGSGCFLYLRDRANSTTTYIGPSSSPPQRYARPTMSDDGRFVAYSSTSREPELYDRELGVRRSLYIRAIDGSTSRTGGFVDISGDGRFFSFTTSTKLAYGASTVNGVYVHDLIRVSQQQPGDFNADGATDLGVIRPMASPSPSLWSASVSPAYSSTPSVTINHGTSGDLTAPGDYDGDGITDAAVFRPSNGNWIILSSYTGTTTTTQFGQSGDKPVAADYDGDNKTDIAVFRPGNGTWYLQQSRDGFAGAQFGTSGDKPVPSDYDNDGKADLAVYRPSDATWYLVESHNSNFVATQFGVSTDIPVQNDYDGDGKTDLAVWRPSTGYWYYVPTTTGTFVGFQFGASTDKPIPGDYDNDGKADKAVFRPGTTNGEWYLSNSSTADASYFGYTFELATDTPLSFANLP